MLYLNIIPTFVLMKIVQLQNQEYYSDNAPHTVMGGITGEFQVLGNFENGMTLVGDLDMDYDCYLVKLN